MDMQPYQYQILKYIHDRATGEFVNLGVVIRFPEGDGYRLMAQFLTRSKRVAAFFGRHEIDGRQLLQLLKAFKHRIETDEDLTRADSLEAVTRQLLPPDNSSLVFGEVKSALGHSAEPALNHLYERLVERYTPRTKARKPKQHLGDQEAWKQIYKNVFRRYDLLDKLEPHDVPVDVPVGEAPIHFEHAWKNGSWHCFEPVSFDAENFEKVRNRAWLLSGMMAEMQKAQEPHKLYFLALMPQEDKKSEAWVRAFFDEKRWETDRLSIELISEQEAESFAAELALKIATHPN